MQKKKIMPTAWLGLSLLLVLALHFVCPLTKIIPFPFNLLGIVPLAFGIAINLMADKAFLRAHTTVKPFEKSSALITGSAFRISRNPMYLGFVSILLGAAVLLGSCTPYAIAVGFAIVMDRMYIRAEEEMLYHTFGKEWIEYSGCVRRWV